MPSPARRRTSVAHVAHPGRVEPGRRLVEDQQPGPPQERRRQAQTLAHAVGVAAHAVAAPPRQLDDVEHLLDPVAVTAAVELRQQVEVRTAAQVRVEGRVLNEPGHALERRDGIEHGVAAEEPHLAGRGLDEPEHHPQRRRLARPVRPQVAVNVAGLDGDVDAGDGLERPVRLAQARGRRRPVRPRRRRSQPARHRFDDRLRHAAEHGVGHPTAGETDDRPERGDAARGPRRRRPRPRAGAPTGPRPGRRRRAARARRRIRTSGRRAGAGPAARPSGWPRGSSAAAGRPAPRERSRRRSHRATAARRSVPARAASRTAVAA